MKQLLLILVLFSTSLSFSVTTEELARQIRSGSLEEGMEIYAKKTLEHACWYLNSEFKCLASSNNTNEASTCIDKVKQSNRYTSDKEQTKFLDNVLADEMSKRNVEAEAYIAKTNNLNNNPLEFEHWKKTSYVNKALTYHANVLSVTIAKEIMKKNQSPQGKSNVGFWVSILYLDQNKFMAECSKKKGTERFKCMKKEILSITKEVNAMYSCHEF